MRRYYKALSVLIILSLFTWGGASIILVQNTTQDTVSALPTQATLPTLMPTDVADVVLPSTDDAPDAATLRQSLQFAMLLRQWGWGQFRLPTIGQIMQGTIQWARALPENDTRIQIDPDRPVYVPDQYIIAFDPNTPQSERDAYLASIPDLEIESVVPQLNRVVVRLPENTTLPDASIVRETERDVIAYASGITLPVNDPDYDENWAVPYLGIPAVWETYPDDAADVIVAVIDTGICAGHPDLSGRVLSGYDYVDNDLNPATEDYYAHGCAAAGVIAANINNGVGFAGAAPNAQILPLRVLDQFGSGSFADVAVAIIDATDQGADVINLSLGSTSTTSMVRDAVHYAASRGVILVAAAGNAGKERVDYPAAYPEVIAVGAIRSNGARAGFSNFGDGIDTVAPGDDIYTLDDNDGYQSIDGTSFSAPYVSAMVVLSKTINTDLIYDGGLIRFEDSEMVSPGDGPVCGGFLVSDLPTERQSDEFREKDINYDGSRFVVKSKTDYTGENADGSHEIFLWDEITDFQQITNITEDYTVIYPLISDDGKRAVYVLLELNADTPGLFDSYALKLWDETNGTSEIASSVNFVGFASLSGDGHHIAFVQYDDVAGEMKLRLWTESDGIKDIASVGSSFGPTAINTDGTAIAFFGDANIGGTNPDEYNSVFLWEEEDTFTRISQATDIGMVTNISINQDGTQILYDYDGEPNPDGTSSNILWNTSTGHQVWKTASTIANPYFTDMDASGDRITYSFANSDDFRTTQYLWDVSSGEIAVTDANVENNIYESPPAYNLPNYGAGRISGDGERIVYYTIQTADESGNEIEAGLYIALALCDEPPLILQQPLDQEINYDESVTLTVEATGPGILGYQWYEGVSGSTVRPVGDNSPTLTFDNVQEETGYWVRVVNNYGHTDSQTATVTINNLPQEGPAFVVNTTEDVNDGLCDQLHCSLREAILAANQNADDYFYTAYIDLPAGTYPISIDGRNEDAGETGDFDIKVSMEIKGISAESTIIDAQGKDRIFHYVKTGKSFLVEDVTLQNGLTELVDDATRKGRGAVLLAESIWEIEFSHVQVENNQAAIGSIMWVTGGPSSILFMPEPAFSIKNSRFENNQSDLGGIHISGFNIAGIDDSQFLNNTSDAGSALYITSAGIVNVYDALFKGNQGGTIHNQANMFVYRTRFEDNHMSGSGGVLHNTADLSLYDSHFLNNTATENGGAIYNDGRFFIFDTQFTGNAAGLDGGAVYSAFTGSYDATSLTNYTLFKNNAAGRDGGAIYSLVTYSDNTTFDGNKADRHGGAIYNDYYTSLHYVTLTNNVADADDDGNGRGGGINRLDALDDEGMEFSNTVLYGNTLGDGSLSDCSGGFISKRLNLVGAMTTNCQSSDAPETFIVGVDPLLGALQDNGGNTETRLPQPGSPLVGVADIDTCPVYDQRRIVRDTADGCDIGAAEVIQPEQFVADNLIAELVNFIDVNLSWADNTDEETAYHVERSEDGENWTEIDVLSADTTLYQDTGLACYTEYFYRVRTINAYGTFSDYSGTINLTTNCPDPDLPQDFMVTGKTRDSLSFSWVDVDSTDTTYALQIWLPNYENWRLIAELDGTAEAYTHTGLTCTAEYQFRLLILRTSDSRQAVGGVLSDTTADCPPLTAPDNFTVQVMGRSQIDLSWAHSLPQETNYFLVERSLDGSTWSQSAKLTADKLTFSDSSVLCNQTYHYRVAAMRNEDSAITYTATESVITDACPADRAHTVGLYKDGLWQFRDDNSTGTADTLLEFGPRQDGWVPLIGNWDGIDNDGLGVYRNGHWMLRDVSESGVVSNYNFNFGLEEAGWMPIIGDWNGDDIDTVGLYKAGLFILRNSNRSGGADIIFRFGDDTPGYIPIAGDWNGSGADTVGVYKDGIFHLTNTLTDKALPRGFSFGPQVVGWLPLSGDWNTDGITSIGLYQAGIWRLRDQNSTGAADVGFSFGPELDAGWLPVARYEGGVSGLQALRAAGDAEPDATPMIDTTVTVDVTSTMETPEQEITVEVTVEPEITAEPTIALIIEPTATPTVASLTATSPPTVIPAMMTPQPTAVPATDTPEPESTESVQE